MDLNALLSPALLAIRAQGAHPLLSQCLRSNPCYFSCRPPRNRRWFPLRRYKASVSIPQLQSEELKARIRASSILTFHQATSMRSLLLLLSPLELRELILCSPNVLEVILAVFRAGLHGIDVGFH
ncbi:hypothetical protein IHE45_09G085700 [Dioscorea alata]|uniref:Uncharacterized protein n=1 Tax=Dioscorea alata TaxID=55571 RepID=A0ACB7VGN5_DIOAL|nr:hypothetical protein IHE45_09G085700 [Dioscorea alata]